MFVNHCDTSVWVNCNNIRVNFFTSPIWDKWMSKSIAFCSKVGLDYVSCSPYRVPIARLAAAQAEINKNK